MSFSRVDLRSARNLYIVYRFFSTLKSIFEKKKSGFCNLGKKKKKKGGQSRFVSD